MSPSWRDDRRVSEKDKRTLETHSQDETRSQTDETHTGRNAIRRNANETSEMKRQVRKEMKCSAHKHDKNRADSNSNVNVPYIYMKVRKDKQNK